MRRNILIFLLLVKFSSSQITFPDVKTTTKSVAEESEMTEETEFTEESEPTEETMTAETVPDQTTMVVTEAPKEVSICSALNQCMDIGGVPATDLSGKMDVRVNNVSAIEYKIEFKK